MTMPARKSAWQPHQCELLEQLAAAGAPFNTIAERVGHPIFSCRTKLSELRAKRRKREPQKPDKRRKTPKPKRAAPVIAQATASPLPMRQTSTAKLVMDAELRDRISEQGITAGLFGDPRPGRSALDAKKASA